MSLHIVQPSFSIPADGVPLGDLYGACVMSLAVMNHLLIIRLSPIS